MSIPIPDSVLDDVLAMQLTLGWAGEGRCEPSRIGWWQTDVVAEQGGVDFFRRLLPRTFEWASLETVLEAARRVGGPCPATPGSVRGGRVD
jgi:hypothetical protein